MEVVFIDEFGRDVKDFDADIFRVLHWRVEVEVFQVHGAEPCPCPRQHAVQEDLDEFQGCSVGPHVPRVEDYISPDGDSGAVWLIFVGLYFVDHLGMANLLFLVGRDVIVADDENVLVPATHLVPGLEPAPMP